MHKYLGLVLNEHLDYQLMAKVVAKSTSRALGFLIAKNKVNGGMPYDVFTQRYNALVQPVIVYGAGIWGTGNFSCIKSVQYKACHFFLGLGNILIIQQLRDRWHGHFPSKGLAFV